MVWLTLKLVILIKGKAVNLVSLLVLQNMVQVERLLYLLDEEILVEVDQVERLAVLSAVT